MYCGQCGRELKENMLFCPYCGTPAVVPERDDGYASPAEVFPAADADDAFDSLFDTEEKFIFPEEQPAKKATSADSSHERVVSLFEDYDDGETDDIPSEDEFEPLDFENDETESGDSEPDQDDAEDIVPDPATAPEPETAPADNFRVRRESTVIRTPDSAKSRSNKTFIPVQDVDPENIFMDEAEETDAYDAYDEEPAFSGGFEDEDEFEFEDREEGGFFRRHIRGIVGLILLLALAAICFIWASTVKGQVVLAKMNLAWKAEVYADLGYEAYQNNSDALAARYYENAYSRDKENYNYAHSAMVAYYEANQLDKATTMLKACVDLKPNDPEPYAEFLILYPDAVTRPWEITELIRQGYQRTGDQRLNIG